MESSEDLRFFGESVFFDENIPEELEEAKKYLELWEKFQVRRMAHNLTEYYLSDDMIDRYDFQFPSRVMMLTENGNKTYAVIGKKLAFRRKKLPYEL